MSVISGQRLVRLTIATIESMRTEEYTQLFFDTVMKEASAHDKIDDPELTRKRRKPNYSILQHIEGYDSAADAYHPSTPYDRYREIYLEAIDVFLSSLKERFEQPTYKIYASIENWLLSPINSDELFTDGLEILKENYADSLLTELAILKQICMGTKIVNKSS